MRSFSDPLSVIFSAVPNSAAALSEMSAPRTRPSASAWKKPPSVSSPIGASTSLASTVTSTFCGPIASVNLPAISSGPISSRAPRMIRKPAAILTLPILNSSPRAGVASWYASGWLATSSGVSGPVVVPLAARSGSSDFVRNVLMTWLVPVELISTSRWPLALTFGIAPPACSASVTRPTIFAGLPWMFR